jgi:hypothetical protein
MGNSNHCQFRLLGTRLNVAIYMAVFFQHVMHASSIVFVTWLNFLICSQGAAQLAANRWELQGGG